MEEMAEKVEAKEETEESFSFEKETYQFFEKLGLDKEPVLHLVIRKVQNEIKKKAGNVADINHKKTRGRSTETISSETRCHFSRSLVKLRRLIPKRHYKAFLVCEKAKVVDPIQTSSESPKYLNWNLSSLNTAIKSPKGVEQPDDQDLDQSLKDDHENPDPLDNENELPDDKLQRNATIADIDQYHLLNPDPLDNDNELPYDKLQRNATIAEDPKENLELNRTKRKKAQEGNISLITDQEKRVLRNKKTKKEDAPHGRVLRDRKTLKGIKN